MPDTLIIGAGAAGIAAARRLHEAGRDVLLIDARDRIGGRAATWAHGEARLDLGCGWLHSARRNPWTAIARDRGFTIETDTANWGTQWRDLGFPRDDRRAFAAAREAMEARAAAAGDGPDRALADFVDAADRWTEGLEAISGYANGAQLRDISLHDWLAYEDAATDDNWAVREGYGTLIACHATGVPVRTGVAATLIDRTGPHLRVETNVGTIDARHVIVAVPTTMLATETLAFRPALPDKHHAAAALPLGLADKAFLSVSGTAPWSDNAHLVGKPGVRFTGSYRLSPMGWPVVEAFLGGDCAEALEEGDACAFAIEELVAVLGSDWRARLTPLRATRWRHEAWIGGSYSHARVGHRAARGVLAEPVDGRIFFAGEACSPCDFSTAHGAYLTGVEAAEAILADATPTTVRPEHERPFSAT